MMPNKLKQSTAHPIRDFLPYLWPKNNLKLRILVCLSFASLLGATIITAITPLFFKNAIDALSLPAASLRTVPLYLLLSYGLAKIFSDLFNNLKDVFFARVAQSAVRLVGLDVFKHLHHLSLRFHLDRKIGGVSTLMERGIRSIESLVSFSLFVFLPAFFQVLFITCVIFYIYGFYYVLITLVSLILYILFTIFITEWRSTLSRAQNKFSSESNFKAIDSLINYETVKYFCNEPLELERYNHSLKLYENAAVKLKSSLSILNTGQMTVISFGLVTSLILGAYSVVAGGSSIGEFVLINSYLIQLYIPLGNIGFAYRETKMALVNMEEMFSLLHEKVEIEDKNNAPPLRITEGAVHFENVGFAYTADRQILKNISFTIPAGHTVAVVGASGAGKSTLARLLFRFYDVATGRILIDGQDIRDITQQSLRRFIGIVPQDTVLFNDTIYYNLAYGDPSAPKESIIKAAKLAHLHDFIMSLPQQYETRVGERGLKLSGGEKQRVSIARSLLKNPPIFVFDEATSALDTHTEKEIQQNLTEVSAQQTTLIIAHRLSTIVNADQIIVLDKGVIAERGAHQELLHKNGLYASLWRKQLEVHAS